ncbi:MAG: alpha/beta hydrolase [Clostridiales bacterium GWF2_38_85]|nr:MAG: alpha/beta hydrolase [Clostridiales bacterium GWF2_38_85]HBL84609.1 alpha/beta hydrolase [Clostridiales bacterium]
MAINKATLLALKALSYPDIEIKETYKAQRMLLNIKSASVFTPFYKLWDRQVLSNGREVSVRIYHTTNDKRKNLLIFFHGGGWVTENVDTYNNVCRNLAKHIGCRVVSVEYSLAPEHPFPAGLEDCYAVVKDIMLYPELFDIKREKIVLIGDSAGGNLAAAVSLMARDRQEFSVAKQILIYPSTNNNHTVSSPFKSIYDNGTDYLLTSKRICEYIDLYKSKDEDLKNPYFSPLIADDLSNQPKTLIITAEYDPLRDEGEAYGIALEKAGNNVRVYRMKNALHGFFSLDYRFIQVKRTYELINLFLNN